MKPRPKVEPDYFPAFTWLLGRHDWPAVADAALQTLGYHAAFVTTFTEAKKIDRFLTHR